MKIELTIPGVPIAKKRPRFARRGKFVTTYNCQDTEEGKARWEIMRQWMGEDPIPVGTPIELRAIFYMPIPSGISQKRLSELCYRHVKKPDTDNLLKFLKDCGNGILWVDDSQVCEVHCGKFYDKNPRTEVTVTFGEVAP